MLTHKQEAFAKHLVETGNASEAYRRAYNATKMSQQAIATEASKLSANPYVARMVKGLKEKATERVMVTIEALTQELEDARKLAMADDKGASAAVAAVMGKAKLHGFLVERSENVNTNFTISSEPISETEWLEEHGSTH